MERSMNWRWDQGRLEYFRVQNIRKIACVLAQFDGATLAAGDILREPLHAGTGLLYPPENDPRYKIWRNFGRVFGQQLLATKIDDRLYVTEICRNLANQNESITDEQYIQFWIKRYASPSPSFEGYDRDSRPVFPFCAVIKLALSRLSRGGSPVKAEDAVAYLIGNNVTGEEALGYYLSLRPSNLQLPSERVRQIREMIAVLGQIPFLKWESSGLSIDRSALGPSFEADIMAYATPEPREPRLEKAEEILNQGSMNNILLPTPELPESSPDELSFLEGSRKRVTHIRIERSGRLRQIYMKKAENPSLCNMCTMDTRLTYPWTNMLIEVHHLLPLGSLLKVQSTTTSIRDVVGICPSCHKATHQFYKVWLSNRGLDDFRNESEAIQVFQEAKNSVVLAA
jgi:hypothetical protein